MVEVLLDRGEIGAAQALLDKDQPYWQLVSEGRALVLTARARALFHRGLLDGALAVLGRVGELSQGIENPAWRSWQTDRAVVLAAAGERAEANELLRTDLGHARRWGTSRALGRTLRPLGTLQGREGVDDVRESVAVLETSSARLELAKAKAALGESLAHSQNAVPTAAVDALRSAYLLAAECSAVALREHIGHVLNRLGLEAPALAERTALTTTERSMVQMSLDGAFDQEIAQSLFITTPTVRQTLDGVRRRYQVTSTSELAELLAAR